MVSEFIKSDKDLSKMAKSAKYSKVVSIQLSELFFKQKGLVEALLDANEMQVKSLIFQYASNVSYLQNKYPDLRLNNDIGNFLVYTKEGSDRNFVSFIKDVRLVVPRTP